MKKRIKLTDTGKITLLLIATIIVTIIGINLYLDRIEKINNGEMILVSDSEMDR